MQLSIASCELQVIRSSTVSWAWCRTSKNLIWGEVTRSELRTLPFEVGQKIRKCVKMIEEQVLMPIFMALRLAVFFAILEKPPVGVWIPLPLPPVCGLIFAKKNIGMVFYSIFSGREAPVLNVKTQLKSETQALSGGLQITHWNVDGPCHWLYLSPWRYL